MNSRAFLLVPLTIAALTVAGCGSSGSGSSSSAATAAPTTTAAAKPSAGPQAVTIKDFMFGPAALTVPVGTKVTWTNQDAAPHTATASGAFDTGTIRQGKSGTVTLRKAGTFAYVCSFHPYMKGQITVTG